MARSWRWWHKLPLAVAGLTLLLWLLLWAVAPGVLQQQAADWARQHGRQLQLQDVRINPWQMRLDVGRIALQEGNGQPLLQASGLTVDAELWALLLGRWQLAEFSLRQPVVNVRRDASGQWNWSRFVSDISPAKTKTAEPQDKALPDLLLEDIRIVDGQIMLQDQLAEDTRLQALPLSLHLQQLSTEPKPGGYALSARLDDGTRLDWRGNIGLQPLQSQGVLQVKGFHPASIWGYVHPFVRLTPPQGTLSLTLPYQFDYSGAQWLLYGKGLAARLDHLLLQAPGGQSRLSVQSLSLRDGSFDLAKRQLQLGKVLLDGASLSTQIAANGQPDWLQALPPASAQKVDAKTGTDKAGKTEPGWQVAVPDFRVQGVNLQAEHRGFARPLTASLQLDSLQAAAALAADGGWAVKGLSMAFKDIGLASQGLGEWLNLAGIKLAASDIDGRKLMLKPGNIEAEGLRVGLQRLADGSLPLLTALQPRPAANGQADKADKAEKTVAPAWQLDYPQLSLQGGRLDWRDATLAKPVALALDDIAVKLAPAASQGFDLNVAARMGQGSLAAELKLAANLADLDGRLRIDALPLLPLAPYALDKTVLRMGSGSASADLGLNWQDGKWRLDGRAGIERLALYEPGEREVLLGWQGLSVSGLRADPARISIADITLRTPRLRLILDEQRVPNLTRLLKAPPAPASKAAPTSTATAAPQFDIRAIRVRNARLDFADLGLKPSFGSRIHGLSGSVLGLSSRPGRTGSLALDGLVDEFGDVRIRGVLSPLDPTRNLDMALNFRNVPLGSLNPYSMNFAGWQITDGRLGSELRYVLKDRQLHGENRMVIDHIQLGEEVADYQGTRLPLRLAVALLEDSDGRIDLSLPVAGSLDEPEFSYGHLVWQALRNILVKIVTAPFRALFGGEGFDAVYGDAGLARIAPPEQEKLQKLAELMQKRPKLSLAIGGSYDEALDGAELLRLRVDRAILRDAAYKLQPDEPVPQPDMADAAVRKAVGNVYAVQFGRFAWLKRVATEADTAERATAMRKELLQAGKVTPAELTALATARGEAARALMLAREPMLAARLSLLDADKVKAEKDGIPLQLKLK